MNFGWVVVAMVFVNHLIIGGCIYSVGIFYQMFKEQFDVNSASVSLMSSLLTACMFGIAVVAGVLVSRFGFRIVAVTGGFLAGIGLILSSMAKEIIHLYLSFGFLTGLGLGAVFLPSITIIPHYFTEKRTLAFGLGVAGGGVGTFLVPPVLRALEEYYSWRGALLLFGGVSLHSIICGALFRPVPKPAAYFYEKDTQTRSKDSQSIHVDKNCCTRIFNVYIFTNLNFIILCLNQILYSMTVSVVYTHLPNFSTQKGLTAMQSALQVSVVGICNLIGRIAFGVVTIMSQVNTIVLYATTCMVLGILTMMCVLYNSLWLLMLYAALFGLFSGSWATLTPEITVQLLQTDLEILPIANAYVCICDAIGILAGAPMAGWLYDIVNYDTAFLVGGTFILCGGIIMFIPWKYSKSRATRLTMVESTELNLYIPDNH